jgi:hypothetical protein
VNRSLQRYGTRSAIPLNPSDVACIELINSTFADHVGRLGVTDRLPNANWLAWFLDRYELVPDDADPAPMRELERLRRDLHAILEVWRQRTPFDRRSVRKLDEWTNRCTLHQRVRLTEGGIELSFEAVAPDWNWVLAGIAASAVELMATADPSRLKRCGNPSCSWMYYDTTLNSSKQYCSTTPCGTLMRVRRHRANND